MRAGTNDCPIVQNSFFQDSLRQLVGIPPAKRFELQSLFVGYIWFMFYHIEEMLGNYKVPAGKIELPAVPPRIPEVSPQNSNALAKFLSTCMSFIGFVLFVGGLVVGVILTLVTDSYYEYDGFFEYHSMAFVGLPLISVSLTFGLPFAAVGSYMSAQLREMKN